MNAFSLCGDRASKLTKTVMVQTVVGVFDTASEAEQAVEELVENGFDRQSIDIASGQMDDDGNLELSGEESSWKEDDHTTFGESVSNFFKSLFNGKDESYKYSEVARRHAVVSVYTSSPEQAEEAADILDDCGAIDVNERANLYTNTISTGNTTIGRTDSGTGSTERSLGNVNDRVTQYGDSQNRDRIQTGTFNDPVGGDLDDRISSFADTTTTINEGNQDTDVPGNAATSETTLQSDRWRSRIFDTDIDENLRLRRNRNREDESGNQA